MNKEKIKGKAWCYGDDINTDIISPSSYMQYSLEVQAKHAMEPIDSNFSAKLKPGDILVAGKNFGSGSSRETAPLVLKLNEVGAVVAKSFARIFYRNAINIGLPVVEVDTSSIREGDILELELKTGSVKNITQDEEYVGVCLPEHVSAIIDAGGLKGFLKNKIDA